MKIFGLEIEANARDHAFNRHISILLILLLGFTAANYLYNGVFRPLFSEKIDFEAYYNGALAFRYKAPIYQTMVDFFKLGPARYEGPLPFVYPPCFAIFLSPLAYLSFNTAAFVWLFINQCLFFSGVYLLLRTISRKYSTIEAVVMIFVFMNFTPLFVDYLVGQCNGILFFLITAGLYCYRSGKPIYAGVAIALACAMKVIPLLLLCYALWKRQFKVFLAGSVTLGLIFGYSLLFFDIRLLTWYVKFMMNQTLLNAFHDNHSLTGFFSRLLTHSIWVKGTLDSPMAASVCIMIGSLLVLGVFLFSTRKKTQPTDTITLREYALAVITMLLLSKMTTTLYLVMLLLPLGIMVKEMMDQVIPKRWLFFLVPTYAILASWYPLPAGKFLKMDHYGVLLEGFPAILLSIQFFAVVVLWCYFAFGKKARITKSEEKEKKIPITQ